MEDFYVDCQGDKWVDPEGVYSEQAYKCYSCQKGTHRIDVVFKAPIHAACVDKVWEEFYAASVKFVTIDG